MSEAPAKLMNPPPEPAVHLPSSASDAFAYGWRLGWLEAQAKLIDANNTITRQQAEIERYREALESALCEHDSHLGPLTDTTSPHWSNTARNLLNGEATP